MSFVDRVSCAVPNEWVSHPSQCLYEWQSLIAGLLALAASTVVLTQIRQSEDHRRDDIKRRRTAARLLMPLALAEISVVLDQMVGKISTALEAYGPDGFEITLDAIQDGQTPLRSFEQLFVPQNALSTFQNFAETLDYNEDIKHLSELVSRIQVLFARYNSQNLTSPAIEENLRSLIFEIAIVRLLIDSIYNYARSVDENSFGIVGVLPHDVVWDRIFSTAHGLVSARANRDFFFSGFGEKIARYKESGQSPWLEKFE